MHADSFPSMHTEGPDQFCEKVAARSATVEGKTCLLNGTYRQPVIFALRFISSEREKEAVPEKPWNTSGQVCCVPACAMPLWTDHLQQARACLEHTLTILHSYPPPTR